MTVDAGAAAAVTDKNGSLLAAGVVGVTGSFARGDVVAIAHGGRTVARGLVNYAAAEVERIKGLRTADVRSLLADAAYDEVVHRDNLVRE